jgi:hypothetical protein
MRKIVLSVAFLVMTGVTAAAWFITQPLTATYAR